MWASQPELLNVSQIISKASAYPDIVDGIGEIRQHGLETIESAYKEILDTQMKMLENVEQKEMIEAAVKEVKESQNEDMHVASEGLPEFKAVKAIAVLIGSIALAMILTEVAAK